GDRTAAAVLEVLPLVDRAGLPGPVRLPGDLLADGGQALVGPGHGGSVEGAQPQIDVVAAVALLQDARRGGHAVDDPGDDLAAAAGAHHAGGLVLLAVDGDGLGAVHLEALRAGAAILDQAVLQRPARGHVADHRQVDQHAVHVARAQAHRPGFVVVHVAAPARHVVVPVVGGAHGLVAHQHRGQAGLAHLAVLAAQRAPVVAADLEGGALYQPRAHPGRFHPVFPAVATNVLERHLP